MHKKLKNCSDLTQLDLSGYENVGFHGTSVLSAEKIELNGFLPYKIFESHEHTEILEIARKLDVDCSDYDQWLNMRSVTFTKEAAGAIYHIKSGSHSGQGLANVRNALQSIVTVGDGVYKTKADQFLSRIEMLENAQPILYVVNLSGYGKRLASDNSCYYYHLDSARPIPENSDIGPDRIIARLDFFN